MSIGGSTADQRTSLDHQCDLGASISHLDVRGCGEVRPSRRKWKRAVCVRDEA